MFNDFGQAFVGLFILIGVALVAFLIALPFAVGAAWRAFRRWK